MKPSQTTFEMENDKIFSCLCSLKGNEKQLASYPVNSSLILLASVISLWYNLIH